MTVYVLCYLLWVNVYSVKWSHLTLCLKISAILLAEQRYGQNKIAQRLRRPSSTIPSFSLLRFDFSGCIRHTYRVTHPSHFCSWSCTIMIQEVDCHVTHGGKSFSVTHTWVTGGVQQWLITQKGQGILDQRQLFSRALGEVSVSQRHQRSDISELLSCPDCDDSEHTNGGSVVSCVKLPKVESQLVYIWHFKCFSSPKARWFHSPHLNIKWGFNSFYSLCQVVLFHVTNSFLGPCEANARRTGET